MGSSVLVLVPCLGVHKTGICIQISFGQFFCLPKAAQKYCFPAHIPDKKMDEW